MVWEVKQNRFKFSLILFYLIFSPYLSMFSSPWFLLLPSSSAIFLSPQLGSSGLICAVDSRGVMSHRTPASSLRLQPWMLWPREGHSPRNSSFPVHLTWSRWTGPFPWPNPPAATARPLGMTHIQEDVTLWYVFVFTKTVISHSPSQTLTCVQAVCTPRLRSDRSSLSRKYFPSHHGDTLRLDLPSCCCHPQDAPGDLTKKKKKKNNAHSYSCLRIYRDGSCMSADGVKCHPVSLYPAAVLILMDCVWRQEKQDLWRTEPVTSLYFHSCQHVTCKPFGQKNTSLNKEGRQHASSGLQQHLALLWQNKFQHHQISAVWCNDTPGLTGLFLPLYEKENKLFKIVIMFWDRKYIFVNLIQVIIFKTWSLFLSIQTLGMSGLKGEEESSGGLPVWGNKSKWWVLLL